MALRSDIEAALKELIANEEGMKFQGLAVVLAKLRWPDLVASERKNDLGLDAYVSATTAVDHVGKGLACSITPTLGKITADAKEARKHFSDVSLLIFSTPHPVPNPKKLEWAEKIREQFGYELEVISREEIISSLLMPTNASLCRSFLGIDVAVPVSIEETIEHIRQATAEVAESWATHLRRLPLIELRAGRHDGKGGESADVFRLADIHAALAESRRIVLAAPAGRGKTTTLVQIAQQRSDRGMGSSFLIDLPAWVASRTDILAFVAGMPPFRARSLDPVALAQAQRVEHFSFLLNGWNEVAESESTRAVDALRDLERAFPAAGIIVATRTHHIAPPLPGAATLRLMELTRRQRREYLRARFGTRASELTIMLDGDPVLDDLTRTPFILSEVAALFDAGVAIPASKYGMLQEVVRLLEQSHEHHSHLQAPPLRGDQRAYLGPLATEMTARGTVSIAEPNARKIVSAVSGDLSARSQVATRPEPAGILNTLCAHHILERTEYPAVAFRFEHQQFQEYYAAVGVRRKLEQVLESDSVEERHTFMDEYLNKPAWTEPLRMIAEVIGVESADATAAGESTVRLGALLVDMTLGVDLVFAAELARLSGERIWERIGSGVVDRLRAWYSVRDEHHRQCALTGMVASGSDAFKDILIPLLTAGDQQRRLWLYRLWGDFQPSSLGRDWPSLVRGWPEEARVEFVSEILQQGFIPEIVSFAVNDESPQVRQALIFGLEWLGVEDEIVRVLDQLEPDEVNRILVEIASASHGSLVPDTIKPRSLAAVRKHYESLAGARDRMRVLEQMAELGEGSVAAELKEELVKLAGGEIRVAEHELRQALDIVRQSDAGWVSRWVAEHVATGVLWPDHWMTFVQTIPDDLAERCLLRLETESLERPSGILAILAVSGVTPALARRVFDRIRELRVATAATPDERHDLEWTIIRNLEELFRAFPADVAISGLSSRLAGDVDAADLKVIAHLFSGVGRQDDERLANVSPELRQLLRTYLKSAMSTVLRQDDPTGNLKADVASALAQAGEPVDVADLETLVRADIERVRVGRAAWARGERGRQAHGAAVSHASWHVQAITHLVGTAEADALLLELLTEPEYEWAVCEELVRRVGPKKARGSFAQKVEYSRIWDARAGVLRHDIEARNQRYASAVREQIERLRTERAMATETGWYDHRLKDLGKALAALDSHRSADLVLELMALPGEWDGWKRVDALELLLFNGVVLPAAATLTLLDPTLNKTFGLQDQERSLVERFLCICPYVDSPKDGFRKMREIMSKVPLFAYELQDVVIAVGYSRTNETLEFLRAVATTHAMREGVDDTWFDAVAAVDSPEAIELLLSFVDPMHAGLAGEVKVHGDNALVAHIVEIAQRDLAVKRRLLQMCDLNPTGHRRELLARIVGSLGSSESLMAALHLIDDNLNPPAPWGLMKHLEAAFVEQRRIDSASAAFSLVARPANALRLRLCQMVADDKRRRVTAFSLLGQIELWRLEYGRPSGEPRNPLLQFNATWPPREPLLSASTEHI